MQVQLPHYIHEQHAVCELSAVQELFAYGDSVQQGASAAAAWVEDDCFHELPTHAPPTSTA